MLKIVRGSKENLNDCVESLYASVLTESYFDSKEYTEAWVSEGINENEIYIAKKEDAIIGFMRIDLKGAFAKFPLLRVIAVKDVYRNRGYGKEMLEYYESMAFEVADKEFILVSEFNGNAKRLYQRLDYQEVGIIPDLYKNGFSEYLMIKRRK